MNFSRPLAGIVVGCSVSVVSPVGTYVGAPFVVTVTMGRISSGSAGRVMTRSLPSTL